MRIRVNYGAYGGQWVPVEVGHPASPMVEQAEKARTAFARKRLKSRSVGGFRPDVMMYIASAPQIFKNGGQKERLAITLEIAMLGRTGLDVNAPTDTYTLKPLPGKFSGVHLLAIIYTAFRQIDPTMDTGTDFAAEYQAAVAGAPLLITPDRYAPREAVSFGSRSAGSKPLPRGSNARRLHPSATMRNRCRPGRIRPRRCL